MKLSPKVITLSLALLASASTLFAASVFEIAEPLREEPLNLKATTKPFRDMNADNCALLRVESDVAGELFVTDVTVYQRDKVSAGVFEFYLSYRERNVTFTSPGYMPFRYKLPMALEKGKAYSVGLKSVSSGGGEGKGGVRIETTPAGATVTFNNLPVPSATPVTVENQPVGSHLVKITKSGYRETETTVEIEKDNTVTRQFTLSKLTAALKVNSNPSGAKVVLDGDEIGTTPLDRSDLTPGEGTLVVSLKGYETVTRQVRLVADQPKTENIDLFEQTGSVSITCEPEGTEVFLDGVSIGEYKGKMLTQEKLSLGSHSVKGVAEGYEDANADFKVEYNKNTTVALSLKGLPGAIYITTTPEGADISLDDKPTGKKTGAKLENIGEGEHQVALSLNGYKIVHQTVTVYSGKTSTIIQRMSVDSIPDYSYRKSHFSTQSDESRWGETKFDKQGQFQTSGFVSVGTRRAFDLQYYTFRIIAQSEHNYFEAGYSTSSKGSFQYSGYDYGYRYENVNLAYDHFMNFNSIEWYIVPWLEIGWSTGFDFNFDKYEVTSENWENTDEYHYWFLGSNAKVGLATSSLPVSFAVFMKYRQLGYIDLKRNLRPVYQERIDLECISKDILSSHVGLGFQMTNWGYSSDTFFNDMWRGWHNPWEYSILLNFR